MADSELAELKAQAQASQIFVWTEQRAADNRITTTNSGNQSYYVSGENAKNEDGPASFTVYIKNMSSQPIYDIEVRSNHNLGAEHHPPTLPILMPDNFAVFYEPSEATRTNVHFRDADNVRWTRDASGSLFDRGRSGAT